MKNLLFPFKLLLFPLIAAGATFWILYPPEDGKGTIWEHGYDFNERWLAAMILLLGYIFYPGLDRYPSDKKTFRDILESLQSL